MDHSLFGPVAVLVVLITILNLVPEPGRLLLEWARAKWLPPTVICQVNGVLFQVCVGFPNYRALLMLLFRFFQPTAAALECGGAVSLFAPPKPFTRSVNKSI